MEVAIVSIIIANITGCLVVVCSFGIIFSCIYFHKSKKNILEFSNKTHQGDETTLKIYNYSEEKSSKENGNFVLGKASTLIANFTNNKDAASSDQPNKYNEAQISIENIKANQVIITSCAQTFTEVVKSNNSQEQKLAVTPSTNQKFISKAILNSTSMQLIEELSDQATQITKELEESTKNDSSLELNKWDDEIV